MAEIDEMIARLRAVPNLVKVSAPDIARVIDRDLRVQITAGREPDGKPWPLRQDGGQALENAGAGLRVGAIGTRILCTLKGYIALHHLGTARGGVKRQILPEKRIPALWVKGIREVLGVHFNDLMRGA